MNEGAVHTYILRGGPYKVIQLGVAYELSWK